MSQKNLEIVRTCIDALGRGDVQTALSFFSQDVVFEPLVAGPYHGHAGVVEQWAVFMEEFDGYWFESEELIDGKDDQVLLLWRHGGTGKSSGIPVENDGATIFTVSDGEISHARVYASRQEARVVAGSSS